MAKIVFNTPNAEEHYARLGCNSNTAIPIKKRSDSSPSKNTNTSPIKEPHQEEVQSKKKTQLNLKLFNFQGRSLSSDEDGVECKKKLKGNILKSPRKRKLVSSTTATSSNNKTVSSAQETDKQKSPLDNNVDEAKPSQSVDKTDWDCNTSVESIDLPNSPEQVSAPEESESGKFVDSSTIRQLQLFKISSSLYQLQKSL